PQLRAIAVKINDATKIVFSKSRKDVTWKNSRVLREIDPRDIDKLKQQRGEDILIFGSGSVTSQLTKLGLIDEYQFVVNPILLGSGLLLIRDVPSLKLKLIEAKPHRSGNVLVRYAPAG
ncbi:MAG: dihydrofolate reductase family protein, partial [Gemmatimonadaceae bacterium]